MCFTFGDLVHQKYILVHCDLILLLVIGAFEVLLCLEKPRVRSGNGGDLFKIRIQIQLCDSVLFSIWSVRRVLPLLHRQVVSEPGPMNAQNPGLN